MSVKLHPLQVTFCAYDFPNYVGGPNAWLLRLLPQLKASGIECNVLFFTQDESNSPTAKALTEKGILSSLFPFTQTTRKKVNWILERVAENTPDIFIPNLVIPAYFAAGWVRASGIPTIGILHSDDKFYHAIVEEFAGRMDFFRLSGLVCVSDYLMDSVSIKASPHTSVFKIPYGVPIPVEHALEPTEELNVIYVGRLEEEQKRISDVAHAFCNMVQQVPGTSAKIYGNGSAADSVAEILQNTDRLGKVTMVGRVSSSEIQAHMLNSHVVVLLSDYEGLPIALLEAMACGLVPVCKGISSGIPQLVKHGETGFLVSDGGNSFLSAIKALKESPETWLLLSRNARDAVIRSYSDQSCADHWCKVLKEMANKAPTTVFRKSQVPQGFPKIRRDFLREDFRVHHVLIRSLSKIDRLVQKIGIIRKKSAT